MKNFVETPQTPDLKHTVTYIKKAYCVEGSIYEVKYHSMFKSLLVHSSVKKYEPPRVDGVLELIEQNPYKLIRQGAYFSDHFIPGYYHFLTEFMPMLYAALYKLERKHTPIIPSYMFTADYAKEMIKAFNFDFITHDLNEMLKIESAAVIEVPMTSRFDEELMRDTVNWMRAKFVKNPPQASRKLYISRKYAGQRHNINEIEVQKLMKKHGFSIIYLENHALKEQIKYVSEASIIAGTHGAGLTNLMWMNPGGKVIEFRMKNNGFFNSFKNLANVLGHSYYSTDNQTDKDDIITANFEIDIPALDQLLSSFSD